MWAAGTLFQKLLAHQRLHLLSGDEYRMNPESQNVRTVTFGLSEKVKPTELDLSPVGTIS